MATPRSNNDDTSKLLAIVNTPAKYAAFKRLLEPVRIAAPGPVYAGLPARSSPLDVYDMDKQLMSSNRGFITAYSRILHANLTGQYRLGADNGVPRLGSARLLEQHSLATYFAPFRPILSVPLDRSVLSRWDRSASAHFPPSELPVGVGESRVYWRESAERRAELQRLLPLYRDYRAAGQGTPLNSIGVPVNPNTIAVFQYVRAMTSSALDYNKSLRDVAMLMQQKKRMQDARRRLLRRLAELQRAKLRDINEAKRALGPGLSSMQRYAVDQFAEQFRNTVNQLMQG